MADPANHYRTLDVSPSASQAEIKQAYRRLAKRFHPDTRSESADAERIVQINRAYEVLGDPQRRQSYDYQLNQATHLEAAGFATVDGVSRQQRTEAAQQYYQRRREAELDTDEQMRRWMQQVYLPVNRLITRVLNSLNEQIDELSADPFDDELMEDFQAYLEDCCEWLNQAQTLFRSMPNPSNVAGVAANLYYCLNQLGDGVEDLKRFTLSYDDQYLHTGQELFRIARGLRREAQVAVKEIGH